jgi:hypothetical protein
MERRLRLALDGSRATGIIGCSNEQTCVDQLFLLFAGVISRRSPGMRLSRVCYFVFLILAVSTTHAHAGHGGWSVGVNIGAPVFYRPWYPYCPYYYQPYPVYVAPPPVYIQPAPVVQAVPVAQPAYCPAPAPSVASQYGAPNGQNPQVEHQLQLLANPNDNVRVESVMQLGRLRAQEAIDPLAATLAGDRSAAVRESAARALGLIGSPKALPALQRAVQTDADSQVRHSAQFACEVIQTR